MAATSTPRAPRLRIAVTEERIEESLRRDSSHCMIAESVKAAFPDVTHISVDLQTIRFTDPKKGLRYTYLTPRRGQVAIVNYDQGRKPEPFSMQLRNGQVTRSGRAWAEKKEKKPISEKERLRRAAAAKSLNAAKLAKRSTSTMDRSVPDRVGGRTPPTTPFARRREFGLRALER